MKFPWAAAPGWWVGATCRRERIPLTVFFEREQIDAARAACDGCLVRWRCLTEHLDEPFGVWGGHPVNEREHIRLEVDRGASIQDASKRVDPHR